MLTVSSSFSPVSDTADLLGFPVFEGNRTRLSVGQFSVVIVQGSHARLHVGNLKIEAEEESKHLMTPCKKHGGSSITACPRSPDNLKGLLLDGKERNHLFGGNSKNRSKDAVAPSNALGVKRKNLVAFQVRSRKILLSPGPLIVTARAAPTRCHLTLDSRKTTKHSLTIIHTMFRVISAAIFSQLIFF